MHDRAVALINRWPDLMVEFGRLFRFGIVGVLATLTYASMAVISVEWLKIPPVPASVLSQIVAGVVSFVGHALFSFRVSGDYRVFAGRFVAIALLTVAMNACVTWLLTDVMNISHRITIAIVTVLIPVTNYICNRFWVFHPGLPQQGRTDPLESTADSARK